MPHKINPKIALLGNPNAGKTSLFNHLTGLHQKVGNFAGVTVEKKTGKCRVNDLIVADIIDLPGTYSLYPRSFDEQIVFDFLIDNQNDYFPDVLVVIIDASNLKRNLFLCTQLIDLGFPIIIALNMLDVAETLGVTIDPVALKESLGVPVVPINARNGENLQKLKAALENPPVINRSKVLDPSSIAPELIQDVCASLNIDNPYYALQLVHQYRTLRNLSAEKKGILEQIEKKHHFDRAELKSKEAVKRYELIDERISKVVKIDKQQDDEGFSSRIDAVITHKVWSYPIFLLVLFIMFQAIFAWAEYPMGLIDTGVAMLGSWLKGMLPDGPLTDLLTEGILAGIGGIVIFVPQIAILFAFISILEESGYMARVMFIMDKFMRKFGMSGKSVVPLISGVACAVPAIMSTRNIENFKERVITLFVTPLMSCSARIPVYTVLIALVIPQKYVWGIISLQGLVLMGLYLLGVVAAVGSGYVMNKIMNNKQKSYFLLELPIYRMPRWKNVGLTIFDKSKTFVLEAGKIILAISIILWVLASYGPADKMDTAEQTAIKEAGLLQLDSAGREQLIASKRLEHSFAGHFGKLLEPVIEPIGFDWKIGIALVTSFAAREVFVGTMATIYSVSDDSEEHTRLLDKLRAEINPATGKPFFSLALGCSLLVFYALAMQCMSTLAVVYRETRSIKWPVLQFVYMTGMAYLLSLVVYNLLR